jgi:hypothetical protein
VILIFIFLIIVTPGTEARIHSHLLHLLLPGIHRHIYHWMREIVLRIDVKQPLLQLRALHIQPPVTLHQLFGHCFIFLQIDLINIEALPDQVDIVRKEFSSFLLTEEQCVLFAFVHLLHPGVHGVEEYHELDGSDVFVLEIVSQPYSGRHVDQFSSTVQQSEREGSCLMLHRDAGDALNTAKETEQDVPVDEYT